MKREVLASLWAAHRGAGAGLGALIFLIFVTGTLCTFRDELRLWSSPLVQVEGADRSPGPGAGEVAKVVQTFAQHHPLDEVPRWALLLPQTPGDPYELVHPRPAKPGLVRAFVGGQELAYLGESKVNPAEFVFDLHANLSLRGKLGRVSVGLVGIVCLFLVASGFLIHRHKLRNMFALRKGKSLRRTLGDTHRALGLWGVGFFAAISFSGAVLGLKSVLVLAPAVTKFNGKIAQAKKELAPPPVRRSGQRAQMQPPAQLWSEAATRARALAGEAAFVPTLLSAQAWGDANAQWVLSGSLRGALAPQNEAVQVRLSAVDGAFLEGHAVHSQGWPRRVFSALAPLHYGDFGGIAIKSLYALLGGSGILLVGSGLLIWVRRRAVDEG